MVADRLLYMIDGRMTEGERDADSEEEIRTVLQNLTVPREAA
jgi:hypothetical protein